MKMVSEVKVFLQLTVNSNLQPNKRLVSVWVNFCAQMNMHCKLQQKVYAILKFYNHTSSVHCEMLHYCSHILRRICLKGNILVCYLIVTYFISVKCRLLYGAPQEKGNSPGE